MPTDKAGSPVLSRPGLDYEGSVWPGRGQVLGAGAERRILTVIQVATVSVVNRQGLRTGSPRVGAQPPGSTRCLDIDATHICFAAQSSDAEEDTEIGASGRQQYDRDTFNS